jgi:hypothetical protein
MIYKTGILEKIFEETPNDTVGAHCMCPNPKIIKNTIVNTNKI